MECEDSESDVEWGQGNMIYKRDGVWWILDLANDVLRGPYETELAAEEGLDRILFASPTWPR